MKRLTAPHSALSVGSGAVLGMTLLQREPAAGCPSIDGLHFVGSKGENQPSGNSPKSQALRAIPGNKAILGEEHPGIAAIPREGAASPKANCKRLLIVVICGGRGLAFLNNDRLLRYGLSQRRTSPRFRFECFYLSPRIAAPPLLVRGGQRVRQRQPRLDSSR